MKLEIGDLQAGYKTTSFEYMNLFFKNFLFPFGFVGIVVVFRLGSFSGGVSELIELWLERKFFWLSFFFLLVLLVLLWWVFFGMHKLIEFFLFCPNLSLKHPLLFFSDFPSQNLESALTRRGFPFPYLCFCRNRNIFSPSLKA